MKFKFRPNKAEIAQEKYGTDALKTFGTCSAP